VIKEQTAKLGRARKKLAKMEDAAAAVKSYVESAEAALHIAQDRKLGKRLFSAVGHATQAWRRARRDGGLADTAQRLVADQAVHDELRSSVRDLEQAYARLDTKRHGRRIFTSLAKLTSVAGLGSLAAMPQVRERVSALIASASRNSRQLADLATENIRGDDEPRLRSLEDLTKEKLYARAQEADIPGRSEMSKDELIDALRVKG
jgi:hypothetical protein